MKVLESWWGTIVDVVLKVYDWILSQTYQDLINYLPYAVALFAFLWILWVFNKLKILNFIVKLIIWLGNLLKKLSIIALIAYVIWGAVLYFA